MPSRNDPCPCGQKNNDGTPKKYKYCCLQKKQIESEKIGGDYIMSDGTKKLATWKLFLISTIILAAISVALVYLNYPRLSGALFGCGMLAVVIASAFRTPPPSRKDPGNGANIDYGN